MILFREDESSKYSGKGPVYYEGPVILPGVLRNRGPETDDDDPIYDSSEERAPHQNHNTIQLDCCLSKDFPQ